MTQLVTPAALMGLATDLLAKGWQPVWCLQRQSGAFTPLPGTTGGSASFPAVEPQPEAAHKLAFRPPVDVVVLDVDHYDAKRGMDTIDRAEDWLGPLPPTYRVSARGAGNPSGRYLYRKPADLDFTDSALAQFADEDGHTHVEVVRTAHRFSWAAGEVHYKNNELIQCYNSYDEACEMPAVSELPELPQRWVDYLRNPPTPYSALAYTRPSDGPEWWLSQADASLGTRAELAQFAFDLLGSRLSAEDALHQLRRVARADDPARPWEDKDFYGLVDRNTERKVGEQLARQDAEWDLGVAVAGDEASLRAKLAEQHAGYDAQQQLFARVEPQVPFDADTFKFAVQRLPVQGLTDEEIDVVPSLETRLRSLEPYHRLLFDKLARVQAEKDAARILAEQFTDYTRLTDQEAPPSPSMLKIIGRGAPASAVIAPGTVTVVSGHRASGKTWVVASWAAQEITAGGHVVWIDFERQAALLREKLSACGIPDHLISQQVHYAGGALPSVERLAADIQRWSEGGLRRVLLVVDAFRGLQSLIAPGTSANDGDAVEQVYLQYLNPLANTAVGGTVVVIDHQAKTQTDRPTTFGSERKESAADYVLHVEQTEPFSRGVSGFSALSLAKDRYGNRNAGETLGYLWVPSPVDGKIGPSFRDYPKMPELRSWSPHTETDLEQMAMSDKSKREVAATSLVRDNRLRYGRNELARMLVAAYSDLFETESAGKAFLTRMTADGKLALDRATRKYDLPDDIRPQVNTALAALLNGDEPEE